MTWQQEDLGLPNIKAKRVRFNCGCCGQVSKSVPRCTTCNAKMRLSYTDRRSHPYHHVFHCAGCWQREFATVVKRDGRTFGWKSMLMYRLFNNNGCIDMQQYTKESQT